jgi:hypothetical protein
MTGGTTWIGARSQLEGHTAYLERPEPEWHDVHEQPLPAYETFPLLVVPGAALPVIRSAQFMRDTLERFTFYRRLPKA